MRKSGGGPARIAWLVIAGLLVFMVAFAAGCGSDDDDDSGDRSRGRLTEIGETEGELNLVGWAGYVEDGSTDPDVDWVTDFEKETGCEVNVKIGNTSDEMVQLMRTGQYDAVSASGDATVRLIEGGDVDPVNTDLVPELRRRLPRPQGPAVQLGRRPDVRDPARPRGEPAHATTPTRSSPRPPPGTSSSTPRRRASTRAT